MDAPSIKAVVVLDENGARIAGKYYDKVEFPDKKKQVRSGCTPEGKAVELGLGRTRQEEASFRYGAGSVVKFRHIMDSVILTCSFQGDFEKELFRKTRNARPRDEGESWNADMQLPLCFVMDLGVNHCRRELSCLLQPRFVCSSALCVFSAVGRMSQSLSWDLLRKMS